MICSIREFKFFLNSLFNFCFMKKLISVVVGMAVLMSSCSNQNNIYNIPGVADVADIENVSTILIDSIPENKIGLYSEIYSNVHYIPLESGQNSIIGCIDKIQVSKNNDIVIFDRRARIVLRFDSDGKFINKIGNIGHAENEYTEPLDVVYDEFRDNVVVYDNAKKRLLFYDMNGKYIHSILLNEYIGSFEVLDNDHIVLYVGYCVNSSNKETPNYIIINTKGEIVKEFAFYDRRMYGMIMSSDVFFRGKGKLYCHIPKTPVVNEITLDSLTPTYIIDFANYQVPEEWYTQGYDMYYDKVERLSSCKAVSDCFFQTDNYTLMTFDYCNQNSFRRKYLMIASNDELTQPLCYSRLVNDMYGKQNAGDLKYVYKNNVYYTLDPSYIQNLDKWETNKDVSEQMAIADREIMNMLPDGQPAKVDLESMAEIKDRATTKIVITDEEKKFINIIQKSQNPILQVCTLKE